MMVSVVVVKGHAVVVSVGEQVWRVLLVSGQFPPVHPVLYRLGHQVRAAGRQRFRCCRGVPPQLGALLAA